jgi:hypothetical protein
MLFDAVLDRFIAQSPVTVMVRGLLEHAFAGADLDALFKATAKHQYTQDLLFSTVVDLLALVACRIQPSVHAAYQDQKDSLKPLYGKLARTEPGLSEALVRPTADRLRPVLRHLGATRAPWIRGYATKILDGNHLAATEHRLRPLRTVAAGPLPGQTLVVLEPEYQLATDLFAEFDGHAQERSLLDRVLDRVREADLWVADRNFCTTGFLFGLAKRKAKFLIRQHGATLRWQRETHQRRVGRIAEGVVYEQTLWLEDETGRTLRVRRVTLVLDQPTKDGDTELHLLTNLPVAVGPSGSPGCTGGGGRSRGYFTR